MHLIHRYMLIAGIVSLPSACAPSPPTASTTVAAAASLANVLDELLDEQSSAGEVKLRLGGTDFLARQIAVGSDADVFIAADDAWMKYLAERGRVGHATTLCQNRLVLVTRPGVAYSLESGGGRLAIADPGTVPAGRYARQTLEALGLWETRVPQMVWAGDVRMALAFVERGAADAAIVYATDAKASPGVEVTRVFDGSLHDPINYPIAPVTHRPRKTEATALIQRLLSDEARPVFLRHGFEVPTR